MEPMKKICVICAQQRSGTTALQFALEKAGSVSNFREAFHDAGDDAFNYFRYLNEVCRDSEYLRYPSAPNRRALIEKYFSYLDQSHDKDWSMIDIKYNSWHHFDPIWKRPLDKPFMMVVLNEWKSLFIHVIRKNIFQCYLSSVYAQRVRKFHYLYMDSEEIMERENDIQIVINPIDAHYEMLSIQTHQNLFTAWLSSYSRVITLQYESLFLNNEVDSGAAALLQSELEFEGKLQTPLIKTPIDPSQLITNKAEILAYFANGPFDEMIKNTFSS